MNIASEPFAMRVSWNLALLILLALAFGAGIGKATYAYNKQQFLINLTHEAVLKATTERPDYEPVDPIRSFAWPLLVQAAGLGYSGYHDI